MSAPVVVCKEPGCAREAADPPYCQRHWLFSEPPPGETDQERKMRESSER